ncbi:SDR family NAD(P)-dependent oxidoreductase [Thermoleophilia bacterium SCSIO 60948]|nr:SDR family NAD(P)-dependent oxidoreductase [Thermoleophilia bacterium SCSIO 60948]
MAQTLLTGASGFIGSHLARALADRGDDLVVLARRSSRLDGLEGIDFKHVTGDVTDRRQVRRALDGVSRVFNVAGATSMRERDREQVFDTNVRGARTVFEEALEAGVERVVHTSSVVAVGPARPNGVADETQPFRSGGLGITYVNSKREAEVEGLRMAAKGLPIVFTNPAFVLGPDDPNGTSMSLVRRFLLRQIPIYVDGALNIVDVRDVARGHLLADEKGEVGERYILGARNFTFDRLFADLSRISGVEPPPLKVPGALAETALGLAGRLGVSLPTSRDEVRSAAQWWTYSSAKAKRELGFDPRPHEGTLEDAVAWQSANLRGRRRGIGAVEERALKLIGGAARTGHGIVGR